jgi:cyclopropane fatty-acyl-phospholipid synthase-like methyltransferase
MTLANEELAARLRLEEFPRSAGYDAVWVLENLMGPNVLWLTEALCQVMDLRRDARVLDLGCGRAISSIFLAKEFAVQVWATDLWIRATDNWRRIEAAGLQERVFPIHADARSLPFPDGFFDVLISLDAYHYFGTDDLYLERVSKLVKPGGQIGIVVPGLQAEFENGLPQYLSGHWQSDFWSFHSPDWWARHWKRTGLVTVTRADVVPNGWRHWLHWLEVCRDAAYPTDENGIAMLKSDDGRNLGFTRVVAVRRV